MTSSLLILLSVVFSGALAVGVSTSIIMGINFNDTTQPAKFEICSKEKKMSVQISAPVGELLQAFTMSPNEFTTQQGGSQY